MGSESLDFLTDQELEWIKQSEIKAQNLEVIDLDFVDKSTIANNARNPSKTDLDSRDQKRPKIELMKKSICELTISATSLCKRDLSLDDKLYVMSADTNIRLGSIRKRQEVVRLNKEDSSFIATLTMLDICEFEFKLIYIPPKLWIGQDLLLELTIKLHSDSFSDNYADGIFRENNISAKKSALDLLFKRAGLLKITDVQPSEKQCNDLVGSFGTMFCTRKKFRPLEVPIGMHCNLRDYQKEALGFMCDRETAENDNEISPLYQKIPYLGGGHFYYSSFLGEIRKNLPMGNVCKGF